MDHPLSKTGIVSSALALKELTLYTLIFVCIIFRAASMYVCIYVCVRKESRNFGQLSECVHLMYEVTSSPLQDLEVFRNTQSLLLQSNSHIPILSHEFSSQEDCSIG